MRNVIIFIVDGRRTYRSDDPKTTKLDFMYEFGKDSVEFEYVACSAPSTAMSLSAILSGVPSYYLSKTFVNLTFKGTSIQSLNRILEKHGYSSYGISSSFGQFFYETMDFNDEKYREGMPPGMYHTDVNNVMMKSMLKEMKTPFFLMVHYTRGNHDVVDRSVREGIEILKNAIAFDEAVFIMTADHGYPDPSIKRREIDRKGHDLVVTDDNVLVPFYIRYPGCKKGKKIKTMITHLDVLPTVLDILGLKSYQPPTAKGNSLLHLIKTGDYPEGYENLKIRIDNRYIKQPGRITAIRGPRFKYVYYHDKPLVNTEGKSFNLKESFYDLKKDPHERKDLINTECPLYVKNIREYRKFFEESEREAIGFQKRYVGERRFYLLRQLWGRRDTYANNPSAIMRDLKRQVNLIIYRISKLLNRPYTSFR